jgi:transcriptional regulator with XRE-family HTH domain
LHDTLLEGTTARQWSAINAQIESNSQEYTAKKLGVSVSTISRTLKRGHYWHMIETIETMAALLTRAA